MKHLNGDDIVKMYTSLKKGDILKVKYHIPAFQKSRYVGGDDEGYFTVNWKTKQRIIKMSQECSEVGWIYFIHLKHISGGFKLKVGPSRIIQHFTKPKNTKAIKILYGN